MSLLLCVNVCLSACGTFSESFAKVDRLMVVGDVAGALRAHEQLSYPPRDVALRDLNQAMLMRVNGDLRGANQTLEAAKSTLQDLSRLSVAEQAGSLLSNDEFRAYDGLIHERIYLHIIKAMNYLQLDDRFAARVEVLQMDVLMRELAEGEEKAVARVAPFARYFSGLVYDALGESSDAMIAFRQAYLAYRERNGTTGIPEGLKRDLLRLTRVLGLTDELDRYRQEFELPDPTENGSDTAAIVVFVLDGLAPGLREESVLWQDLVSSQGRMLRISMPSVVTRFNPSGVPQLRVGETGARKPGELGDDIDRLVRDDLEDRKPAMAARAVARQVLKQSAATAVTHAAKRKADSGGEQLAAGLLSIGAQFAAVLTERADTRSWSTLPGRIWVVRQPLAEGRHNIQIEMGFRRHAWEEVSVSAGEKKILVWQPVGPSGALGAR